jgi:hypothetical protein
LSSGGETVHALVNKQAAVARKRTLIDFMFLNVIKAIKAVGGKP